MGLSTNKNKVLLAMLNPAVKTVEEIADVCGLAPGTIYNYQRDPEFRKALQAEQGRMLAVASTRLADGTTKAVQYLLDLIDTEEESTTNRRLASIAVLDIAHKYSIGTEVLNRIEAIEQALNMRGK